MASFKMVFCSAADAGEPEGRYLWRVLSIGTVHRTCKHVYMYTIVHTDNFYIRCRLVRSGPYLGRCLITLCLLLPDLKN